MTTDFRALCAELLWALENEGHAHWSGGPDGDPLVESARAALAEPEPEGPVDEEIMELMPQQMRDDLAAAARALAGFDPDNIKAASVFRIILNRHCVDHARAVLARWGRPAPQPVPVSERPWEREGWCDDRGYCWWYDSQDPGWVFDDATTCRHWADFVLPAHALPVPTSGEGE